MQILKICENIEFLAQGVVVRKIKKETQKNKLIFGVMPFAKMRSAKRSRKNKIFFAPVLCLQGSQNPRMAFLFWSHVP